MFICCSRIDPQPEVKNQKIKKVQNFVYKTKDLISESQRKRIYMGLDQQTGNPVAIKTINVNPAEHKILFELVQSQIALIKQLHHPNIVQCINAFKTANNCYIVNQYCSKGDLARHLKIKGLISEEDLDKIVYDIAHGLFYLNSVGVIHRNLCVQNIYQTEDRINKIANFKFAAKSETNFKDSLVGIPKYMSPQTLYQNQYGPKTDLWAFGILLYELLHGYSPFEDFKTIQQIRIQMKKPIKFKVDMSKQLKNFLQLCLDINHQTRISIPQIFQTKYIKRVVELVENNRMNKMTKRYGIDRNTLIVSNTFETMRQQQALALLHYCRLLHKTTKIIPSLILEQWLLILTDVLSKIKMNLKKEKTKKIKQIILDYNNKFSSQHQVIKKHRSIEEVIREIEHLLRSPYDKQYIQKLLQQTQLLKTALYDGNLVKFTKSSNSESFLQSKSKQQNNNNNCNQFQRTGFEIN